MDRKHLGSYNEMIATLWLMERGYEVFRNVSAHGLIDLVALKDGVFTKFDVKMAYSQVQPVKLTQAQMDAGVIGLKVYPDGSCEVGETLGKQAPISCKGCDTMFTRKYSDNRHVFCTSKCRKDFYAALATQQYHAESG
jgi:hypothetical protein